MKTAKAIIESLEQDFYFHHNLMDQTSQQLKEARKNNYTWQIEMYEYKVCEESTLCCYICDVLADIKETDPDYEMHRLYKKFNLFKDEE